MGALVAEKYKNKTSKIILINDYHLAIYLTLQQMWIKRKLIYRSLCNWQIVEFKTKQLEIKINIFVQNIIKNHVQRVALGLFIIKTIILLLFFLILYIGDFQQQAADRSFRSLICR